MPFAGGSGGGGSGSEARRKSTTLVEMCRFWSSGAYGLPGERRTSLSSMPASPSSRYRDT